MKNVDRISVTAYSDLEEKEELSMAVTTKEILNGVLDELDITQKDAAKAIGLSAQSFGQKLSRGSLRSDEFLELMDELGIDVKLTAKKTQKDVKPRTIGHGRSVKGMSDGVIFDTKHSDAISNNFYEDGEHEYHSDGTALELYRDSEGRYFVAEYDNNGKDRVRSVPESMAEAFIEKYGMSIEKNNKKAD